MIALRDQIKGIAKKRMYGLYRLVNWESRACLRVRTKSLCPGFVDRSLALFMRVLAIFGWSVFYLNNTERIGHQCIEFHKRIYAVPNWMAGGFVRLSYSKRLLPNYIYTYTNSRDKIRLFQQKDLSVSLYHAMTADEKDRGKNMLAEMGIGDNDWFVCFHNRESGYLPEFDYHSYRDCKIEHFIPAMSYILENGGKVVRMGDPTMTRLPPMDGVIDYPHSEWRSDFADIYLGSHCRFFVGVCLAYH